MSNNPGVFTKNNAEGIERVKETDGKYAFFMESAAIEYAVENACGELAQVGGNLDTKGYGIALKRGSPYTKQLSLALNQLQEGGELHKLKTKWWKQKGGKNCAVSSTKSPE